MSLRQSICGQVGSNTGAIDCDPVKGLPVQIIPGSAVFAPADYVTNVAFEAAFLNTFLQPAGSPGKLFPFPVIQGNTAKTTAAKYGTLGYGLEIKLLRSKQGYEFDVIAGSALEKKLIKFDGQIVPLFIFDDKSRIWGVLDSDLNFKGARYLIGVEPKDFEDGQNAKTTKITISIIDSRDFVENAEFADTSFNASDLVGLYDAELFQTAPPAANVYHIGAKIRTASIQTFLNVHSSTGFPAALAAAGLWIAKTGSSFATTLAITSVVDDPTNGGWTVTFDSTAFTALASGAKILLSLASPVLLDAADVTGIEGVSLVITKP